MAKLEVEQQRPAKANAIKHFGEDVHADDIRSADDQTQYLDDRSLSSETPPDYLRSQRADDTFGNHFADGGWKKPRSHWKRLSIPPDLIPSDTPTGTID